MNLYSFKGQLPQPLPERIRLSSGFTRTDSSTFTEEEIADAGYVLASSSPEYNQNTQKVQWTGSEWEIINLNAEEIEFNTNKKWSEIRNLRDDLLSRKVDWRYSRYHSEVRLGLTTTDSIVDIDNYAQALRDITKQTDPYNIQWPSYGPQGVPEPST